MTKITIRRKKPLEYPILEAINTLCANMSIAGGDIRKILITSCHPNEGKSFVALNLLYAMAELKRRVILVDADIRASSLQLDYGMEVACESGDYLGLSGLLSGLCDADEVIGQTNVYGADMILPGKVVMNSFPLFNSPRLKELLDELKQRYDLVLVDAPPIGSIIDAAKIAEHCDGALFIVQSGEVSVSELKSAVAQIEKTGCPIMGYVLNKQPSYEKNRYYYYEMASNNLQQGRKKPFLGEKRKKTSDVNRKRK